MTNRGLNIIRAILITVLVLNGGLVYGGWVSLGEDEDLGLAIYVDPSTMSHKEDVVTMWILYDFKSPQSKEGGTAFRSAKMQRQYDCAKERTRLMVIMNYADNMGEGQEVAHSSFDQQEWTPVGSLEAGTVAKDLWTLACR
jgi:hypothetical protein